MVIGQSGVNGRNVMYLVEEGIKLGIEHVQSQSHSMVETTVLDTTLITLPVMIIHVLVCTILYT
jgi:hypothetical protein